jgi:hypothetical protein
MKTGGFAPLKKDIYEKAAFRPIGHVHPSIGQCPTKQFLDKSRCWRGADYSQQGCTKGFIPS